jgi:FixJ family two-component response regulator
MSSSLALLKLFQNAGSAPLRLKNPEAITSLRIEGSSFPSDKCRGGKEGGELRWEVVLNHLLIPLQRHRSLIYYSLLPSRTLEPSRHARKILACSLCGGYVKYKAVVLDDDPQVAKTIATLLESRGFDTLCYTAAESLLAEVFGAGSSAKNLPDLLIVDRVLRSDRMQGLDFINELARRDVPSEVLLVSGSLENKYVDEALACGWGAWLEKPFTSNRYVLAVMEHLADTGRKRRLYRAKRQHRTQDRTRRERPVFLSYSHHNAVVATGIRRALEAESISVWYAPDILRAGEEFKPVIRSAVDRAQVFVPLITDNYVSSQWCADEMKQFRSRMESDGSSRLLILPLLYKLSPEKGSDDLLRPIFSKYHYLDISSNSAEQLPALSAQIRDFLTARKKPASGEPSPASSGQLAR